MGGFRTRDQHRCSASDGGRSPGLAALPNQPRRRGRPPSSFEKRILLEPYSCPACGFGNNPSEAEPQSAGQLAHLSKARIIASLSLGTVHDVKNSLTAVIGNLHLMDVILSKLELSPEIRAELDAMLGDMEVSSRSALDTCGRLERLGSGKKTKLRVWLRELVDSTFELAKHPIRQSEALEKKRVVVVNRVPPQIALETVPQELQMAMLNIVLNSVKHGIPPGSRGTVSADASREDGHVDISISNDGVPIPPRLLPSLFKSPLSSDCESGLGLYISAMSIAELGGTISCISDAKGTEFKIRMPAH